MTTHIATHWNIFFFPNHAGNHATIGPKMLQDGDDSRQSCSWVNGRLEDMYMKSRGKIQVSSPNFLTWNPIFPSSWSVRGSSFFISSPIYPYAHIIQPQHWQEKSGFKFSRASWLAAFVVMNLLYSLIIIFKIPKLKCNFQNFIFVYFW